MACKAEGLASAVDGVGVAVCVRMRLQHYPVRCLGHTDMQAPPSPPLSDELADKVLPQIERLLRLTLELAQSWASTNRQWQLARQSAPRRQDDAVRAT